MFKTSVLFVVVVLFGFNYAAKIPEYIHVCKRSDPRVAKCIRESVDVLKPKLKNGIPEIGVPALEPLRIDEIVIFQGEPGSNIKALLKNIDVTGASDFQVTKLKLDLDKLIFRLGVKIPVLDLDGDYDIDVKILVAPIKGNGKFHANITNVEGQGILKAEVLEHEGHRMINFTKFDLIIRFDDYNLHMDNLFNGDPILSRATNDLLNQNKAEFIKTAIPFVQRKVSEILLEIANQITKNLDYDEVFPE